MREFAGGARLQLAWMRRDRQYWLEIVTNPLFAIMFIAIVQQAGRSDLLGHAVLAPAFMGIWRMSLGISGETVDRDRHLGILEPTLGTAGSYALSVMGRVTLVTVVSLVAFAESWLVALVLFGEAVPIAHPVPFVLGLLATTFAAAGTALIMASVFALARSARTFQNSLSYPFYVLGGVIVPVSLLPGWIQPFSRVVFLSWGSDLLRDSLGTAPVTDLWSRLAIILLLGAAGLLIGLRLMDRILVRLKTLGTVQYA